MLAFIQNFTASLKIVFSSFDNKLPSYVESAVLSGILKTKLNRNFNLVNAFPEAKLNGISIEKSQYDAGHEISLTLTAGDNSSVSISGVICGKYSAVSSINGDSLSQPITLSGNVAILKKENLKDLILESIAHSVGENYAVVLYKNDATFDKNKILSHASFN